MIKRILPLLLGTSAAVSMLGSITADARTIFIEDVLAVPDGYVEFDDKGTLLSSFDVTVNSTHDDVYTAFCRERENALDLYVYHGYKYNYTTFDIYNEGIEAFDEIYAKYSEELDLDYYYRADPPVMQPDRDVEAVIYDCYDDDGCYTKDASAMEDKSELIQRMAEEMYEAGCISQADYMGITANAVEGYYSGVIVRFNTENSIEEYDALNNIAAVFTDGQIKSYDEQDDLYQVYVDYFEQNGFIEAVKEEYPNSTCYSDTIFLASGSAITTTPINLLTAIIEESSCDINSSGAPDLDDAVLLLSRYANTAAGIETASETDTVSYDVNGDGSVNLDDAVKILTVYAEMAAGLR